MFKLWQTRNIFYFIILAVPTVLAIRTLEDGSSALPFLPTVVPLAVRSPYLGTYLQDGTDKDITEFSPRFWTGTPIGWNGLIRVDGHVFSWMGNLTHWPAANNTRFEHTASSSIFSFEIGPPHDSDQESPAEPAKVNLEATFLSPITPHDPFRQSLPLSYLSLTVSSADGQPHEVELYTDINGLWCTDDEGMEVEWTTYTKDYKNQRVPRPSWTTMELKLSHQQPFVEQDDRILHGGIWYSAMTFDEDRIKQTHSAGQDGNLTRSTFAQTGQLDLQSNQTFRPIRTRIPFEQNSNNTQNEEEEEKPSTIIVDEPVLGWAHSFGYVSPQRSYNSRTVIMSIGHIRTPVAQYMTAEEKVVELEPLWTSRFKNETELIEFHLFDYNHVLTASQSWNTQLYTDASRVHSQEYGHILAISTRTNLHGIESVRADYPGTEDFSSSPSLLVDGTSTMTMLKEISSNGNCQTVDVIAPMLPFLIYTAPQLIPQLLEPIFRYISTGLYKPIPTPHDLGDHYPNATGRNDFVYANLPLEESGNFLNMVLAFKTGTCQHQAKSYYNILVKWADWLIENTLYPDDQRSTDDFFGPTPNQTSLVVKGIMGLRSMSEISISLGQKNDSIRYLDKANEFTLEFLKIGVAKDHTHILGCYGNETSWSTQYNLYFDKLFGFKTFADWVYEMQDQWYMVQAAGGKYGPPLDYRSLNRAKTDWLNNKVFGDLISLDGGWSKAKVLGYGRTPLGAISARFGGLSSCSLVTDRVPLACSSSGSGNHRHSIDPSWLGMPTMMRTKKLASWPGLAGPELYFKQSRLDPSVQDLLKMPSSELKLRQRQPSTDDDQLNIALLREQEDQRDLSSLSHPSIHSQADWDLGTAPPTPIKNEDHL
ncbi:hypothetical protein PSTT_10157 [Puccinia striiformis]|uniref:Glutaminase n=1 Tax=Puccinia striiformis TaxID=27350 RepID=A0A2S4V5H4_9BASI|nr:hypothetical protein PSTT_10157 [Puccinia striiformis]